MYISGNPTDSPKTPQVARSNGGEAISEGIQNHVDRLAHNAVSHGSFEHGAARVGRSFVQGWGNNAPADVTAFKRAFSPGNLAHMRQETIHRESPGSSTLDSIFGRKWNPITAFATEAYQQFKPTSRNNIIGDLGMLAGGPEGEGGLGGMAAKGDATPMLDKLGMKGQFRGYNQAPVDPLSRGITHEGPGQLLRVGQKTGDWGSFGKNEKQIIMDSLARRAQGVGGYRRPGQSGEQIMNQIEATRASQSKQLQARDAIKEYSNRGGFISKKFNDRARTMKALGGKPMSMTDIGNLSPQSYPWADRQSYDFTDRMQLHNLIKGNPDNPLLQETNNGSVEKALYDMLFGGKGLFRAKGMNRPRRP